MTPNDEPLYVTCPECGNEQGDMGRNVECEECGYSPMPSYSYPKKSNLRPPEWGEFKDEE
jgi:hypothetical protein